MSLLYMGITIMITFPEPEIHCPQTNVLHELHDLSYLSLLIPTYTKQLETLKFQISS